MGRLQVARRHGRCMLVALCFGLSISAHAQPASAPSAPDAAEVAKAAASAASAVAAAKAAASAASAASAAAATRAASAPSGQCPAAAQYCQPIAAGWLMLVLGLYAAAFAAARWHFVARPNLHNLEAQVRAMRHWVAANPKPSSSSGPDDEEVESLLTRIEDLASPEKHSFLDQLLWSRGKDLVGWTLFYQAWELLVTRQSPDALRCYLEEAAQLPPNADPATTALAKSITTELQRAPLDPRHGGQAILQELSAYLARFDKDLDGEIDRMLASRTGAVPPTAAAALILVKRVGVVLRPPASLAQSLATFSGLLPLWQQLINHARDVAIPGATTRHQALDALTTAAPAPTTDACLDALEQSREERRMLQALALRLSAALDAAPLALSERRIALARQALALSHYANLTQYDTLFTWHRKNLWLGMTTLLLVLLLALAAGQPLLFLMGAFGGLLSRLRLAVTSGGLGESPDLHWTTLFLSPLLGALAAWGGLLLISLGEHFGVLGSTFSALTWDAPLSPTLLGVALLLGFAERLFLDVASRIQSKFEPTASPVPTGKAVPDAK